jgi:spore maturation protein CgeB
MKLVIFGLTVSSSWSNGHATLWRGLCRALTRLGHSATFYEKDLPYYAAHRDLHELPGGGLRFYAEWQDVVREAELALENADVGVVTSYCPDALAATELILGSATQFKVFYDLDTPVTLTNLARSRPIAYLGRRGLRDFDLVLSFTGGNTLGELKRLLGARRVEPLYGCVDPEAYRPCEADARYRADLSHLGTYAEDRKGVLSECFVKPSRLLPDLQFTLGGSLYPEDFPWSPAMRYLKHVPPPAHPAFYSSSRFTLNATRATMAAAGYCPSGRLFEAAGCGTAILTDPWEGLEHFFAPQTEVVVVRDTAEVVAALGMSDAERNRIAAAARERALSEHTAEHRVRELEAILSNERSS